MPQDWFAQNAPTAASAAPSDWFAQNAPGGGGLRDPKRRPVSTEDFLPPQREISPWNILKEGVKSLNPIPAIQAAMADQRPEDAALGPMQALAPFGRMAVAGAKSEAGKTAADLGRGRYSEAAGHAAATVLPLVGPAAAQAGEDIGSGDTERIERGAGSALGLVGSTVAPRVVPKVAPPLATIGEQLASKGRAVSTAVGKVNPVVLDIAGELVGQAVGAHLGVPTLARRVLGHVLEEVTRKNPNKGGRVVGGSKLTDTEALAGVLDELRAPVAAQPKVTLQPQPTLPPGYTPRAATRLTPTVIDDASIPVAAEPGMPSLGPDARSPVYQGPERRASVRSSAGDDLLYAASRADRERAAARFKQTSPGALENQRMAAERAAADAMPPAAKRAYFLKSPEELAAVADEAVAPSGSISPDDLPAAWRQHTGQDLFPVTGEEGKAVAEALKQELQARGMSVGEAMARVSANKSIPTKERAQLIRALNQSYAQR